MKKIFLLLAVFILASFVIAPVSVLAQSPEPLVTIDKSPYCKKPPNVYDTFSNNGPYYTGIKYYWWINITVANVAGEALEKVVVYDRLGGEFMIEGICINYPKHPADLPDYPGTPSPGFVFAPFDYDFVYNTDGDPYEPTAGGAVDVDGASGTVDKDGIAFGDSDNWFDIYWTGNSCKAHFTWDLGPMDVDEVRSIFLVISTDLNPAGHQEFTSPGIYYLNSGATAKVLEQRGDSWKPIYTATAPSIMIEVDTNGD